MTWLSDIILSHQELESPDSYWYWAALASISAVMKDQVWFNKFIYNVYPNIYVMLHGESGIKKGPPINMAKRFVKSVNNTKMIVGRASIQGALKKLGTAYTVPGQAKPINKSIGFWCASEFSSSLIDDPQAVKILTDLYDRNWNEGEWEQLLKLESFTLKDPSLVMLVATNEAMSEDFMNKIATKGGYIARTFIIHEPEATKINSLMYKPENMPDDSKSIEYLKKLSHLNGEFKISDDSRKYFDQWYRDFRFSIKGNKDPTGTLNRFDDSVWKVAMLISLASNPELFITQEAIEEAIVKCEKFVGSARKTTMGTGKSQWANEKALIINELVTRDTHMISFQQINKKYWMNASAQEWHDVGQSLEAAGIITVEQHGANAIWAMPAKVVEEWQHHLKGRIKK